MQICYEFAFQHNLWWLYFILHYNSVTLEFCDVWNIVTMEQCDEITVFCDFMEICGLEFCYEFRFHYKLCEVPATSM